MSLSLSLGTKTYTAPVVYVCFKGYKGGNQVVRAPVEFERTADGEVVEAGSDRTITQLINEAWQIRFHSNNAPTVEIGAVYESTALTLANQTKLNDFKEMHVIMELHHLQHGPAPTKPLWLLVEVINGKIARETRPCGGRRPGVPCVVA